MNLQGVAKIYWLSKNNKWCIRLFDLNATKIAYPFHDKRYTISKMIMVVLSLRNAHLFTLKKVAFNLIIRCDYVCCKAEILVGHLEYIHLHTVKLN